MIDEIKLPHQEWLGYDPERGDIHGYTFEQMREFADLIVRECVRTLNGQKLDIDENSDESDWTDIAWNNCINHCSGKLNSLI